MVYKIRHLVRFCRVVERGRALVRQVGLRALHDRGSRLSYLTDQNPVIHGCKYVKDIGDGDQLIRNSADVNPNLAFKEKRNMETGSKQNESDCVPNEFDNVCIEASVPNIYWSKDLVDLYNDYMKLVGSDDWRKYPSYFNSKREERLITRCLPPTGKMLEYALFLNVKEKTMHGIVQFGPWLEGPTTLVHGGVIATFLDMIMGVLAEELGYLALTMNLSVDYLKPLPLRTVAVAEAKLDKVDGKKVYLSAMLRSADGKIVYDKCTTLFYTVSSNESEVYRTERK